MATKRPPSPSPSSSSTSKKPKTSTASTAPQIPSLHAWLHPDIPPPLITHSPPLHNSTSTFLSFSISFIPPSHVTTEAALVKEVKRVVRELNVVGQVGDLVMKDDDGAFQDGEGRIVSSKGKERAREPDHRMWAVRCVCLKEGRDGTKGEDDYHLLETFSDDGEKFGGERVLRILKEERGSDVITVCCRWYGGDMIGPARFQYIGLTAKTSLTALIRAVTLRDLRQVLEGLDEEISGLRETINPSSSAPEAQNGGSTGKYDEIEDIPKLERLVKAREKSKQVLEGKVGWVAMDRAREEAGEGVEQSAG